MAFRTDEQIITAFKARFGIAHTGMSNRDWFAEIFGVKEQPYAEDIWLEFPPSTNQYAYHDNNATLDAAVKATRTWDGASWVTTAGGNTIPVEKVIFPLTELLATNGQSHIALANPLTSIDASLVTPSLRLLDFIKFSHYGTDFMPRIFWDDGTGNAPGTEITTVSLPNDWIYDAVSGFLLCGADASDQFIPAGNLPIWVQHYRYVGAKGVTSSASNEIPVACLSTDNVGDVMCVRDVKTVTGRWRVERADPTDNLKMPGVGILVSKSTPTTGIMIREGSINGLYFSMNVKKTYFVGVDGRVREGSPQPGLGEQVIVQKIGIPIDTDELWLTGEVGQLAYRRG